MNGFKQSLILSYCLINLLVHSQSFNPTNLTGLKLWYKSDTGVLSNNDSIYQLTDLSGNNNHAFQSNKLFQPLLIQNAINSYPVIRLDGIDDFLPFNSINTIKDCFFVIKHSSGNQNYATILGSTNSYDFIGGPDSLLFSSSYTSTYIQSGIIDINNFIYNSSTAKKPKEYSLIRLKPTAYLTAENIGNDRNSVGRFWSGDFAEIIVFDRSLTTAEYDSVTQYLNNKYTSKINLGPDIYITNNVCDTSLIPLFGNYTDFFWSTTATTPSIVINQPGKYWVRAKNNFGFYTSDTVFVKYPYNTINDTILCSGSQYIWDTNLQKSNFSFLWSDNSTDSLLKITSPGQYYVNVTDNNGCSSISNTITIIQDNFPSTTSLGSDTNLCSGNSISLKHGNLPGNIYQWNDHSTGSSLAITNSGQYSVVVTNTNNCVAKDTINVTIVGQAPTASISNSPGCKLASTNFTDMSSPPAGNSLTNWRWDFGVSSATNDTSLLQNPTFTYADTGTYVVQLTVKTDVGCVQTTTTSVYVTKKPFVNFTYPIACQNASLQFTGSVNTYSYPIGSYSWSFGDPSSGINNTSTLANPTHTFSQAMFYPVKLVVSNIYGCKDSIIKNINVNTEVAANFTYSSPCKNSPVSFQDNSIAPSPNAQNPRLWDFGDGTTTGLTAIKTYTNSGTYTVSLKVTGTNGCVSTTVKTIDVKLPPVAEYTYTNICVYDTLHLSDISSAQNGSLTSWNWSLDNASFSSLQNPTLSISSSAAYSVKLQVKNSFNCYDSITHIITAYSLPVVDFSTTPAGYYYINTPIAFSPNISNGLSYHWDFSSGSSSVQSPTVSFNSPNTYTVSLLLEDQQGCKNTSTKTIQVQKRFTDLGILDVRTDLGADRFYSVEADLANHGTTPITEFVISYQISNSGFIQESWKDSLKPGNVMTFHFNSKSFAGQYSGNRITCVNINSVNLTSDDNSSNDKLCRALNTSEIQVMEPFPNPSDGDITLPVVLMQDGSMSLMIYDALGQLVYEDLSISALSGLNLLQIPTATFQRGTYILKLHIGHDTFTKKFLKNSGK